MSSDTAKENASVVDSSLTDWKQDIGNSDDPESSSHRSKEDHKLSKVEVERRNFSDQLESSNPNKNSKPGYQTRYFIIKSLNYDNIQVSVEKGIWATQVMNEPILEGAFHKSGRVILIFSVNMSGFFQGYAEMLSPVGWRRDHIWSQGGGKNNPWGRSFKVKWLRLSELPFQKTLHLKNPLNDYKPVKISRDCQELPEDIGEALCELLDANSCDDGLLNSSSRDDYSTKKSRAEPPSSSGDEEYNNNLWGHTPMPYPPAVYANQDDLSRFHLAHQIGYGVSSEYLHTSSGASNSRTEQEKSLRFNSWCLPLESPLANSLTDDDFLDMVVAYLLVIYAENSIPSRPLVLGLDIFCKLCCLVKSKIVMTHYWKLGENICSIFSNSQLFQYALSDPYYLHISVSGLALFLEKHHELRFCCCLSFDKVL
ncbi:YTH domain-containing protein 1 isoform X1 [Arabidopsis lyrata subsp. lyrata]|uniref:YTH domain-containing protein 1 isoform X1 n=1 Tax=Arabidopsis lyrata subsp. lyrata TaxID=81972 RepID=UPI000A29B613|nr:YTH domain-containing protein 1 isoform X1 [Arabidopsis lyrata subsp. lyrata]|eukprot:XP_020877687.1 YTH domain-containing protein 1 isoform X1 [Arabidopsis lyrata subsp. lyrata]